MFEKNVFARPWRSSRSSRFKFRGWMFQIFGFWHHGEAMSTTPLSWRASYVRLAKSGELESRVRKLDALLSDCTVCPHECRVDRRTEIGTCSTGT